MIPAAYSKVVIALVAFVLVAAIVAGTAAIYSAGKSAGMAVVQSEFDSYKAEQSAALTVIVEKNRKLEADIAGRVSQIRVEHQEFINEAEKRAESAIRDVNFANHRLRKSFSTCANSINVLADSEAAARADAEGLDTELRRVHEFHVSRYTRADKAAGQLNALIGWVEASTPPD